MTITPKNLSITNFLALCATPITTPMSTNAPTLVVKEYDYKNWKWVDATDSNIIAAALEAASKNSKPYYHLGETVYCGDLFKIEESQKHRVKVIVR